MSASAELPGSVETSGVGAPAHVALAKGLYKAYRMGGLQIPALNGVDLVIGEAEFMAVTGPSGSGKSTLLNLLGLVDAPTRGSLIVAGSDVARLTSNERAEVRLRQVGFVFQFFNLFLELTALENVMFPALLAGERPAECRARALSLLETVGLADRATHPPARLSGGEQQRVSVARALINNPALLLADEPTAHLDSTRAREILDLLARLNVERRQTTVLVTHEAEYCALAQRTIVMRDGRVDLEAVGARRAVELHPPGEVSA